MTCGYPQGEGVLFRALKVDLLIECELFDSIAVDCDAADVTSLGGLPPPQKIL